MNWTQIIQELIDAGMTQQQIADKVGISQPTLHALYVGKNKTTAYEYGDKLVSLWKLKRTAA